MKRIIIAVLILISSVFSTFAQLDTIPIDKLLSQANEMYKSGQFSDAAKFYEEATNKGVSPELYYNLGNSYYKSNEIGLAILNYERALRLDPSYADAKYNLELAESKIVDNVNSTPTFFLKKWFNNLIYELSSDGWMFIGLFFFLLAITGFFIFTFSGIKKRRKLSFYLMIVFIVLMITSLSFSGINKNSFVKHNEAIITVSVVVVKSSPDETGTDIFQLHEGTHVKVKSKLGEWSEITLENGAVGWVKEEAISRI